MESDENHCLLFRTPFALHRINAEDSHVFGARRLLKVYDLNFEVYVDRSGCNMHRYQHSTLRCILLGAMLQKACRSDVYRC